MRVEDIPPLPGYVSAAQAAAILGINKVSLYYKIYEQEAFRTVFKVVGTDEDQRPVALLLLEKEVLSLAAAERAARTARMAAQEPASFRQRLALWNKRVKTWGINTGWDHDNRPINGSGAPVRDLQLDYLRANPDDPRPQDE